MATFVEKAVLLIDDRSSAKLSKIESAMKRLNKQAKLLERRLPKIKMSGISSAQTSQIQKTASALNRLATASGKAQKASNLRANFSGNTRGINNHINAIDRLVRAQGRVKPTVSASLVTRNNSSLGPRSQPGAFMGDPNSMGESMGRAFLRSAQYRLANALENAIIAGFGKGTKKTDVSTNNLKLLGLDEGQIKQTNTTALNIADNSTLGFGDAKQLLSEVLPTSKNNDGSVNVERAGTIARLLLPMIETSIAKGVTVDQSTDGIQRLSNSFQSAGLFTDAKTGDFDAKSAETALRAALRAQIEAGQELTFGLIASSIAALNATKFTALNDERDMVRFLLRAEQDRQAAGVGQNAAVNNMAGYRTMAKQAKFLDSVGLGRAVQGEVGTTGGKKSTKTRLVLEKENLELINTSFQTYVDTKVIPAMTKAGYDPTDPSAVKDFASRATSDRKATAALVQAIITSMDISRDVEAAMNRDVSAEKIKNVGDESLTVNVKKTQEALTAAMGEVATSMNGVLIPALRGVSKVADSITSYFVNSEDPAKTGAIVGGGAAAVGTALWGSKKIFDSMLGLKPNTAATVANTAALNRATASMGGKSIGDGLGGKVSKKSGVPKIGLTRMILPAMLGYQAISNAPATLEEGKANGERLNAIIENGFQRVFGKTWAEMQVSTRSYVDGLVGGNSKTDVATNTDLIDKITETRSDIEALSVEIAQTREGKSPELAALLNQDAMAERTALEASMAEMQAALNTSSSEMATVFQTGADSLSQVGPTITSAAQQFGPTAGAGMMPYAAEFGQIVGAQIQAAASNISVNLKAPKSTPDLGEMTVQ